MADRSFRHILIAGAFFGLAFLVMLAFRLGLFEKQSTTPISVPLSGDVSHGETWMTVLQNDRKIGYSHSVLQQTESGYFLREELFLRINTMGVVQDLTMNTSARLLRDMSLDSFDFQLESGPFRFSASGRVDDRSITVSADSDGNSRSIRIPVETRPSLSAVLIPSLAAKKLNVGETFRFSIFDPTGMTLQPVMVQVDGEETISYQGRPVPVRKMSVHYQGVSQTAWIDQNGSVLREEGLLGLRLEKATREEAVSGIPLEASRDLTLVASVPSNVHIDVPAELETLSVRIGGIRLDSSMLDGGRQSLSDNLLQIRKESLHDIPDHPSMDGQPAEVLSQLGPSLLIQSDHPRFMELIQEIISPEDAVLIRISKIISWITQHVEKRPVLSIPDALATLDNRVGDCNEHAVLFAALARAAGIPTRVEAGLVYLNGRFYYHAWNGVFVGRWISVDAMFGQLPADVTHLRFAVGEQNLQAVLISLVGQVTIQVEAMD